jgi:hypothetical protein
METPRLLDQVLGTLGLVVEGLTFAVFTTHFVIARAGIGGTGLPLSRSFIHYILMPVFLAAALGVLGLFYDGKRLRSIIAIVLVLPLLAFMGVLDGNF